MLESLQSYCPLIGENNPLWKEKVPDRVVQLFIDKIDELEKLPVNINNVSPHDNIEIDYSQWIKAIEAAIVGLKKQKHLKDNLTKLEQRLDGLRYRITAKHGGEDCALEDLEYTSLEEKLIEWKKLPAQFNLENFDITEHEKDKLKCLAKYTSVAKRAMVDGLLMEKLFNWLFRLNGDVDLCIEFPHLAEKMTSCRMQDWVGYIDNDVIKMEVTDGIKTVQMKYIDDHGQKKVSLLDVNKKIVLEKELELSIHEIFKIHLDKETVKPGFVCLFNDGLRNWNSRQLGRYDKDRKTVHRIDVTREKWWQQLPIVKKLTLQQAKDKYGENLGEDEKIASFALCASSNTSTVNVDGTHAYNDAVLPIEGEESYAVYSFGSLAKRYPQSKRELLDILFKFVPGAHVYPEETMTDKRRRLTWTSTLITEEVVNKIMKRFSGKVEQARAGQLGFSLFCSGCSKKAAKHFNLVREWMGLQPVHPFDIHFTEIDATGFIATMLKPTTILPKAAHNKYLSMIFLLGRPMRKTTFTWNNKTKDKSCWEHKSWDKKMIKSPAQLFKVQEKAKKEGKDPLQILPQGIKQPGFLSLMN